MNRPMSVKLSDDGGIKNVVNPRSHVLENNERSVNNVHAVQSIDSINNIVSEM